MPNRREFLATGSAVVAASALKARPSTKDLQDWGTVRDQFELAPDYTHLSMFFMASHPRQVRTSIEQYRQQIDRNPFIVVDGLGFGPKPEERLPTKICERIAKYIGADANDIALTQNTTTGLSILYHGLPLKQGDDVLLTTHDHYVHQESARFATERSGATLRKIALFDSTEALSTDEIVDRVKKAILPNTVVMGMTWVLSSNGVRMPIRAVADALAAINAQRPPERRVLLFVDGVHGMGVEDPHITQLGCDAFSSGTHKWVFGPRGTGFIWGKPEVWARMRPLIPTMHGMELFAAWANETDPGKPRAAWFSPGGFQAFEHHWSIPAALDFHEAVGPARVTERIHALNLQLNEALRAMPHVQVYTPRTEGLYAGIVSFDVKGMKADDVVAKLLEKKIIASTSPVRVSCARLSCGIMNTPAEVEKAAKAIRALA
jgi:isopenicillin-N epimerase